MAEGEGFEPPNELPRCRFSRPVLSTTQPPLLNRGNLPFFKYFSSLKLEKIGKVSKKFPKIGFLFLAFNAFFSNHKIIISCMNTSFFLTTYNYACKSLIRLNFTFKYEPVQLDVFILFRVKFPKNLTLYHFQNAKIAEKLAE